MASSGKKGKKNKPKFVPFVPGPAASTFPVARKTTNWADEVEDESVFDNRPKHQLPTAPRAACVSSMDDPAIPKDGPFIAYISNLTYNVDEQDLEEFFGNLQIKEMRLPREDKESGKIRGFGYVEFNDRNSLIEAVSINNTTLKGRRMHIEVAQDNERGRRGNRMDMNRDRPERSEDSSGDWRAGPRAETYNDSGPMRRGGGGFNNRERDSGYEASEPSKPGAWRDSTDRPSFRDNNRDKDRGFTRRNFDRDDNDGSTMTRGTREPTENAEPRTRTKLALQPRKEPIERKEGEAPAPVTTDAEDADAKSVAPRPTAPSAASIFGAAKPVDTAAREREIEEKIAREKENKLAELAAKKEAEISKSKVDAEKEDAPVQNSWRVGREENKDVSPSRARQSRVSPNRRRYSPPRRRDSPSRRRDSPSRRRDSPSRRRDSPSRRRDSPPRRRDSPPRRRDSPPRRRDASPRRRDASPRRGDSPRRRDASPRKDAPRKPRDGPPPLRKTDSDRDKKPVAPKTEKERGEKVPQRTGAPKGRFEDKPHKDRNNTETRERNMEERMPKLKEQEPPNFAASNKFAFLETDNSD